jgi:hypothetical protein
VLGGPTLEAYLTKGLGNSCVAYAYQTLAGVCPAQTAAIAEREPSRQAAEAQYTAGQISDALSGPLVQPSRSAHTKG